MDNTIRYYRDIRLTTQHRDYPQLLTQTLHGLHACISEQIGQQNENKLGIGFPAWNSHGVGYLIRLVSIEAYLLEQIEYEPVIARLLENCYIAMTPLEEVPEHKVHTEFAYYRDRKIEKTQPGFIARQNRRRLKRGLTAIEQGPSLGHRNTQHYINLLSKSNQSRFSLFIKREPKPKQIGCYNSYGLADKRTDSDNPPTIPHFATQWQPTA